MQRDNILGPCVIHTFDIPVPLAVDPDAVLPPLQALLEQLCAPYVAEIEQHLALIQTQKLFITPAAHPRLTCVPHDDKVYNLIVRFACRSTKGWKSSKTSSANLCACNTGCCIRRHKCYKML